MLQTKGLEVRIADRILCRALDFAVYPGQSWAILGRNGAGKTTLLHTLLGLNPATKGTIRCFGRSLADYSQRDLARHVGLLPQDLDDPFPSTVLETALIGRHPHLGPFAWEGEDDLRQARQALKTVSLQNFEQRQTNTLSGGERRRLGLATLLTQSPQLYLLDEPANHLDLPHQQALMATLLGLAQQGHRGVVMVLHDVNLARRYCDHALLLFDDGETQAGPAEKLLNSETLGRLYGYPLHCLDSPVGEVFVPA
jgi:iron complex transport system ATP-binding protein